MVIYKVTHTGDLGLVELCAMAQVMCNAVEWLEGVDTMVQLFTEAQVAQLRDGMVEIMQKHLPNAKIIDELTAEGYYEVTLVE